MPMKKRSSYGRRRQQRRRAPPRARATQRANQRFTTITAVKGAIIPDKMLVKLPYMDYQPIGASSGAVLGSYGQKTYNLNYLYDPEPSALNSFTLGFNQYKALYKQYRVYAASYEISLWNGSDDTSVAGALYVSNETTPGLMNNGVTSWLNQPRSRRFTIGNKSGGRSTIVLRGKVDLPKYAGLTPLQYKTEATTAAYLDGTTIPEPLIQLYINTVNTNQSVNAGLVYATVKIIYHIELFDRVTLSSAYSSSADQAAAV